MKVESGRLVSLSNPTRNGPGPSLICPRSPRSGSRFSLLLSITATMTSVNADVFTVCAEAFSVVGLADIVFRHVAALSDLAIRAASASASARDLLSGVKALATAIAAVRNWAENYEASGLATQDGHNVDGSVKAILFECGKQLATIRQNLHSVDSGSGQSLDGGRDCALPMMSLDFVSPSRVCRHTHLHCSSYCSVGPGKRRLCYFPVVLSAVTPFPQGECFVDHIQQ